MRGKAQDSLELLLPLAAGWQWGFLRQHPLLPSPQDRGRFWALPCSSGQLIPIRVRRTRSVPGSEASWPSKGNRSAAGAGQRP